MFFWSVFLLAPVAISFFAQKYRRYVSCYFGLLLLCFAFFIMHTSSVFGDGKDFNDDIYIASIHPAFGIYLRLEGGTCDEIGCGVAIEKVFAPTSFSQCSITQEMYEDTDYLGLRARFSVCKLRWINASTENEINIKLGQDSLTAYLMYTFFIFGFFVFSMVLTLATRNG